MSLIKIHGPCKTQTGDGRGGSATLGSDLNEVIQNQTQPSAFAASARHRDRTPPGFEQRVADPGLGLSETAPAERSRPLLTCPGKAEVPFLPRCALVLLGREMHGTGGAAVLLLCRYHLKGSVYNPRKLHR